LRKTKRHRLGQATIEYILLLVVAVLTLLILSKFLRPTFDRLSKDLSKRIETLFQGEALYHFPLKK
jgi:hypothetical protein